MKLRRIGLYFFIAGILSKGSAQQLAAFSYLVPDPMFTHISNAGWEPQTKILATFRDQWRNIQNHPQLFNLSITTAIEPWSSGMGVDIVNYKSGLENHWKSRLAYTYWYRAENFAISGAAYTAWAQSAFDGLGARTPGGFYGTIINHNDPLIEGQNYKVSSAEFGVSIGVRSRPINFSLSLSHVASDHKIYFKPLTSTKLLNIGLNKSINFEQIRIIPNLIFYTDFVQSQAEILLHLDYKNQLFLQSFFKSWDNSLLNSYGLGIGFRPSSKTRIFYRFESSALQLGQKISGNSQEFGIEWNLATFLGGSKKVKWINNPRWSD